MKYITFREYAAWRQGLDEGMWMNDDKAVAGMSKLPQPKPKKQAKPQSSSAKPTAVAKIVFPKPQLKPASLGTP